MDSFILGLFTSKNPFTKGTICHSEFNRGARLKKRLMARIRKVGR